VVKQLEEYAEHARDCREAAAKAVLPEIRAVLLKMAERWEELARQRAAHMHLEDVLAELLKNGSHNDNNHNGGASVA
jgi:Tfp pilus assembly protein PilO